MVSGSPHWKVRSRTNLIGRSGPAPALSGKRKGVSLWFQVAIDELRKELYQNSQLIGRNTKFFLRIWSKTVARSSRIPIGWLLKIQAFLQKVMIGRKHSTSRALSSTILPRSLEWDCSCMLGSGERNDPRKPPYRSIIAF